MPDEAPKRPPAGDAKKAEKYISKFVTLIKADKLTVTHTDLSKFDPSALQDHYRVDFSDFSVEVSHSKQPNTGADSYVMLFTNINQITQSGNLEKVILAYLHLDPNQFIRFKDASHDQKIRIKKAEEEKRFNQAIVPIDQALEKLDEQFSETHKNVEYLSEDEKTENLNQFAQNTGVDLNNFSSSIQNHNFPETLPNKPYTS